MSLSPPLSPLSSSPLKVAKKSKEPIKSTHSSGRGRPAGSVTKPPIAAKNPVRRSMKVERGGGTSEGGWSPLLCAHPTAVPLLGFVVGVSLTLTSSPHPFLSPHPSLQPLLQKRAAAEAGGKAMQRLFAMAAKMQVRANSEKAEEGEYTKLYLIVERNGTKRDLPSGNEQGGRPKTSKEKDEVPHHSVKIFSPDGESGFEAFRKDALRWGGRRGRANIEYMSDLAEVETCKSLPMSSPPKKKSKASKSEAETSDSSASDSSDAQHFRPIDMDGADLAILGTMMDADDGGLPAPTVHLLTSSETI